MRWVFFCLLVLNVVYLVWNLVLTAMPEPARTTAPATVAVGEPLVLLSEVGVKPVEPPVGDDRTATASVNLCATLGPWPDVAVAEQALAGFRQKGYEGEVRPVRIVRERLHWVFLPAAEQREAALRVLRELQNRKVDSFVVAEGPDANAISLGYFSSAESARGLMVKMRSAGYPAEIRETSKEVTEHWIYFAADGVPDDGAHLRQVIAQSKDLTGRNVACGR